MAQVNLRRLSEEAEGDKGLARPQALSSAVQSLTVDQLLLG
jgi:hypothetical protein